MSKGDDNYRLVYSSENPGAKPCKQCGKLPCKCQKSVSIVPEQVCLKIRLEKKGRGGKLVSLVFDLPHNPEYFKEVTKKLKNICGSGGSYKDSTIELQGDQRAKAKSYLESLGFQVKLAGG